MKDQHTASSVQKPAAKLIVVIGLPGSGKTTYLAKLKKEQDTVMQYDDYGADSYNHDPDPRLSQYYSKLLADLKRDRTVVVSDIRYCEARELHIFLGAILSAAPDILLELHYFDNQPHASKNNIISRNRKDRVDTELELLEKYTRLYEPVRIYTIPTYVQPGSS